jgi:hypothetical protein
MLTIEYRQDGKAYGDHEAERAVRTFYQESRDKPDTQITMVTSTEVVIRFALVLIAEGVIPAKGVVILSDGKKWYPNEYGQMEGETPPWRIYDYIKGRHFAALARKVRREREGRF